MSSLVSQQTGAALYYAVLGKAASAATFDSAGQLIENGGTSAQYVAQILSSSAGQALYSGKSTSDIVSAIYTNVYGSRTAADGTTES
ncbi:hypothetical protein ABZ352_39415, partial [Streptomyces griseofuscus]|uniref:hypothetical protein n=1 Tax=Streptomyces griseofuscus TaxID=146922 RepID=UPI0033CE8061